MSLYCINPNIKIRQENWGGLALTSSGKLIIIKDKDVFSILAAFIADELEDHQLPNEIAQLVKLGLIIRRDNVSTESIERTNCDNRSET